MSHKDYIDRITDIDQLRYIVDFAEEKIHAKQQESKTPYLVVCDNWRNLGYFNRNDVDKALEMFCKVFKQDADKVSFEDLRIEVQRHRASEMEDLVE